MEDIPSGDIKHKLAYLTEYFKNYPNDELRKEEIKVIKNENQEKIELPNYGVLDITLDKEHLDHLHHLVEKYEPDNAKQQWMLIDDDNRFQKEVLRKV